ncbi:MAG: hypothetical protein LLG13_14950 [Bacteroidales bacterium]|nr:hypothetical protein [Bacteroidales bacterium]
MKKIFFISFFVLILVACKKTEFSPEGPTDVRVRNLSDLNFEDVIVSTSEKVGDTILFGVIAGKAVSEYFRFSKAYSKAEISAKINIGGTLMQFSTGPENYTYMDYKSQVRMTFEVYISDMNKRELTISNIILEEPLVLK